MPPASKPPESPRAEPAKTSQSTLWQVLGSFIAWGTGLGVAGFLSLVLLVGVALAMAYPQLPDISDLADYRPKLSMRVFSAEGKVIGEDPEADGQRFVDFLADAEAQAVLKTLGFCDLAGRGGSPAANRVRRLPPPDRAQLDDLLRLLQQAG